MESIRLAFDPQIFIRQRAGGISRVFADLATQFAGELRSQIELYLPFRRTNNVHLSATPLAGSFKRFPPWVPRKVAYVPTYLRGMQKSGPWNAIHHTYYDRRFLAGSEAKFRVSTIHDMIPERFKGSQWVTSSHLSKRAYVSGSHLVICVSEATREDMFEIYGVPQGQVVVVPNSVSDIFRPGLARLPDLPRDYVLYVGKREGYKDFRLLPEAVSLLRDQTHEIPVVVVGLPPSRQEVQQLRALGVGDLFKFHQMDDIRLAHAYSNAAAVIQTSRYEGFGITPLEGMASGVPVIVAHAAAMPEVGGKVAQYFSAGDSITLAEAILRVTGDSHLRSKLSELGIHRAKLFSCENMAENVLRAYLSMETA